MKRFIRSSRHSSSAQSSSASSSRVTGNGGMTTATTVPSFVENHPTRMSSDDSSNSKVVLLQLPSPLATATTMTTSETSPCDSHNNSSSSSSSNNNNNNSSPVSSVGSCCSSQTARSLGTGTFSYDGRGVPAITLTCAPVPDCLSSQQVSNDKQRQQSQQQKQQQQQQPPVLFLTTQSSASSTTVTSNAALPRSNLSPSLSSSSVTISPSQPSPPPSSSPSSSSSSHSRMNRLKETSGELLKQPVVFKRRLSSFLRVADLDLDDTMVLDDTCSEESYPNFSYASSEPPPGMTLDPQERWVALDDGTGKHAPIAPHAIRALCQRGLDSCLDESMWTLSDGKMAKLLESDNGGWYTRTWQRHGSYQLAETDMALDEQQHQQQVLVWTGTFQHGFYGSDLPAVRAAGWIDLAPDELLDLLVDSSRVQEYNKLSLGRTDELVLQATMHDTTTTAASPFGGITKVVTSESRPPLLRKTLRFTSILHARELHDHSGYVLVTRAVTAPAEDHPNNNNGLAVVGGEILMGVNLIKRIEGCPNSCILITVNHIRSPLVPMMIAKRIGLTAAVNFMTDVRKVRSTTAVVATAAS